MKTFSYSFCSLSETTRMSIPYVYNILRSVLNKRNYCLVFAVRRLLKAVRISASTCNTIYTLYFDNTFVWYVLRYSRVLLVASWKWSNIEIIDHL